ncbi:MAG: PKD domain-containing protein, partial [Bacteroidia bacterium]|nr:PKD domain-containing protein [Bacteroidia bacterium]
GSNNSLNDQYSLWFGSDIAIIKYSPDGSQRIWATYLGGSHNEQPHSLVTNRAKELYILGTTRSLNFPTTPNAFQKQNAGKIDIIVSKISEDGAQLLASTYLGGSEDDGINERASRNPLYKFYADDARGEIILDEADNCYVATSTSSPDFPTTSNTIQTQLRGLQDACIFKFNRNLSDLIFSTYWGGNQYDAGYSLKIDNQKNIVIVGGTNSSTGFPVRFNGWQSNYNGGTADGYVLKITPDARQVLNATYIGTSSYDQAYLLDLDRDANIYFAGQTEGNFPIRNARYSVNSGSQFIVKIDPRLSAPIYSTRFGSGRNTPDITLSAFMVDLCENVYISGWGGLSRTPTTTFGSTRNLPTTLDALQRTTDGADFYLAVFERNMQSLLYATFFGGNISEEHVDGGTSRFDKKGIVYQSVCAGCGGNDDFPTTPNAWSRYNNASNCNNGSFKLAFDIASTVIAEFDYEIFSLNGCAPYTIYLRNKSQGATAYIWHLGNGQTTGETNPIVTFPRAGVYTIKLIAINPNKCNQRDEVSQEIVVSGKINPAFDVTVNPCARSIQIQNLTQGAESYIWDFGDGSRSTARQPGIYTYRNAGRYTLRLITNPHTPCADTLVKVIEVGIQPKAILQVTHKPCSYLIHASHFSTPGGGIARFFINQVEQTQLLPATYNLARNGRHVFTLIYSIGEGCADTTEQILFLPPLPRANFEADSTCSRRVHFKNTSLWASNFLWNFGDRNQTSTAVNPTYLYPAPGTYRVRLIAEPFSSCPDTVEKLIHVSLPPQARFRFQTLGCPQEVEFINQTRNGNNFLWLINGERITAHQFTYTFPAPGRYLVTLIANPNSGCPDLFSQVVEIKEGPHANFYYDSTQCALRVVFENRSRDANNFLWEFGDGTQSRSFSPIHNYRQPGSYKVRLIAEPGTACADTVEKWIFVRQTPIAAFTYRIPECNLRVFFENLSYGASSYYWDFGDGNYSKATSPIHLYEDTGIYRVRLTANPDSVCPQSFTLEIHITKGVGANFKIPAFECNFRRQFENNSPLATYFWWDFGDSNYSQAKNPVHIYKAPGTYTVRLIAEGIDGCRDTIQKVIKIPVIPTADFIHSVPACNGKIVLQNRSKNSDFYIWKLGDGTISREENLVYQYNQTGNFNILLTAYSVDSCHASVEKNISIAELTRAKFESSIPKCTYKVVLKNQSFNAQQWYWYIDNILQSTEPEPSFNFSQDGEYSLQLIVLSENGCRDTASQKIRLSPKPIAQFSAYNARCSDIVELKNQSRHASHYLWLENGRKLGEAENLTLRFPIAQGYEITLIADPTAECPDTFKQIIQVDAPAIAKLKADSIYCKGKATLESQSLNAVKTTWYFQNHIHSIGQNKINFTNLASGTYKYALTVESRSGCKDSVAGLFIVKPIALAHFRANIEPCNPLVQFNSDSSTNASQFVWKKGNKIFSQLPNPTEVLEPGINTLITLIINPDSACPDTFSRNIWIEQKGKAAFWVKQVLCDSTLQIINLSQNAKNYFWHLGDGTISNDSLPAHRYLAPGKYTIKLIINKATFCADSIEKTVEIPEPIVPQFKVTQQTCGPKLDIQNYTQGAKRFRWEFSDGTSSELEEPIKSFAIPGVYTIRLIAYDAQGCEYTRALKYPYDPAGNFFLDIPNVFTPNGDGLNDKFEFARIEAPCIEQVEIYDRWGVRIFFTQDYTQSWDGTYNNQPVPEGVYIYIISVGKQKRVGNVTVIR